MKRDMEKSFLDKYWPVGLLFVPVLLYFLINGVGGGSGDDKNGNPDLKPVAVNVKQISEKDLDPKLLHTQPKMRKTKLEVNRDVIKQYEEKLRNFNISTEDRQALLLATANLYMVKINDLKMASSYYLQFIDEYPDSPKYSQAYLQLLTCYETLKDEANTRAVLRRMKDAFPANTPEHQLAVQKLDKGEIDPVPRINSHSLL